MALPQPTVMDQHRVRLEEAFLGAVLFHRWRVDQADAWRRLVLSCELLDPQDFTAFRHIRTWEAIEEQVRRGEPVDPLLVYDRAIAMGVGDACLDVMTLEGLMQGLWHSGDVVEMARSIKKLSLREQITAHTEAGDLEAAGEQFGQLRAIDEETQTGAMTMAEMVEQYWDAIDADRGAPVPWSLPTMDRVTGGMLPGQLIVAGARPSVGKSALGITVALRAAQEGRKVGIVSLEMDEEEIMLRVLAIKTGIATDRIKRFRWLEEYERKGVGEAMAKVRDLPFYVAAASINLYDVVGRSRAMHRAHHLDLLVVDYLQLIRVDRRTSSRVDELEMITGRLKQLGRELGVPVLALAQLNRGTEEHQRPRLSDFRSSGSIEQDADIALLLSVDEQGETPVSERIICHIAKHRNGRTGFVNLRRVKETTEIVEEA